MNKYYYMGKELVYIWYIACFDSGGSRNLQRGECKVTSQLILWEGSAYWSWKEVVTSCVQVYHDFIKASSWTYSLNLWPFHS